MERSEIRGRLIRVAIPDCAALHPGYKLHVFQKKSKRGKQTSQRDIDLVRERLKRAGEIHRMKVTEN